METNQAKQRIDAIVSHLLKPGDRFLVTEDADEHLFIVTIYRRGRNASFRVRGSEVANDFAIDLDGLQRMIATRMHGAEKQLL